MQPRRLLFPSLIVSLLAPATAFAAQIAVLAPQLKPPGAAELRDRFHDSVTRGLGNGAEVMPAEEVRSKLGSQLDILNCSSASCARKAALALSVERIVTVDVEYVGKDYSIRLHAFDAAGNELGAVTEEKCDICTVREAARASERAADRAIAVVAGGLTKAAPVPVSRPAAPAVGITEPPRTPTPTPPSTPAVTPSAPPSVTVPAIPSSPGGSDKAGGASTYRIGAYTAFGIAAAALIPTISFGYFASKEKANTRGLYTGDGCDGAALPQLSCPKVYSGNTAPAAVFGVGAGLAAATGVVLLYLDMRNQKRPVASFIGVPTRDGFAVSTSVEF